MATEEAKLGEESLKEGDRVIVLDKLSGHVRFIGTTEFGPGEWVGVELVKPLGRCDGSMNGKRYFTCPAKHGLFVQHDKVRAHRPELLAASKIVSAAKVKLARARARATRNWKTFNMLDNNDEHLHLHRRSRLIKGGFKTPYRLRSSDFSESKELPSEIEADYDGPHIRWPLTTEQLFALMLAFKAGKVLHPVYTMQILERFKKQYSKLPTIQVTGVDDGTRLTICGDTHGQLQDLFSIFTINGPPSETNRYLFNGDFVDRGDKGVEICLVLFAFALLHPGGCLLNRGNHEERSQNETGGFMTEVLDKYSSLDAAGTPRGPAVFDAFQDCFDMLPLATMIEKMGRKVFVVHGGLFERPGVKISHISAIQRKREIPWGRASFEDRLFEDLVWSDPKPIHGTQPSDRGAGVLFGADITENFCAINGISLVIRSHECMPEGYEFHHNNRCMTIFSASRYCGRGTNKGAFIMFDPDLTHTVQQFVAGSLESTCPVPPGLGKLEPGPDPYAKEHEALVAMIIERLCLKKADLYWFFTNNDTDHTGTVSRLEWGEAMRLVLELDLPWLSLCDELVDAEPDGTINYTKFLDRYKIELVSESTGWQESVIEHVCEKLFTACSNFEDFYKRFDVNEDGRVEYPEMVTALERLDLGLTRSQVYELMSSIDTDKDGSIDFEEFASRFKVVFTRVADAEAEHTAKAALSAMKARAAGGDSPRSPGDSESKLAGGAPDVGPEVLKALRQVGAALFASGSRAALVFKSIDENGDGTLSMDEFTTAMTKLELDPPRAPDLVAKVIKVIDSNDSGSVNYVEFLEAFKVVDTGGSGGMRGGGSGGSGADAGAGAGGAGGARRDHTMTPTANWQQAVIEKVVHSLYEYRIELSAAFEMFDVDGSGRVSKEEFRNGLRALTGASDVALTDMQADELLAAIDRDKDGSLDYVEFLSAFRLVDTKTGVRTEPITIAASRGKPMRRGSLEG